MCYIRTAHRRRGLRPSSTILLKELWIIEDSKVKKERRMIKKKKKKNYIVEMITARSTIPTRIVPRRRSFWIVTKKKKERQACGILFCSFKTDFSLFLCLFFKSVLLTKAEQTWIVRSWFFEGCSGAAHMGVKFQRQSVWLSLVTELAVKTLNKQKDEPQHSLL